MSQFAHIVYPLSLPPSPAPGVAVFESYDANGVAVSPYSLQAEVQEGQGEVWQATLQWPGQWTRAQAAPLIAMDRALRGVLGTLLVGDPLGRAPRGTAIGAPVVDGAPVSGFQLPTRNWQPSQAGALLEQDWIQLGSGLTARLYQVVHRVDTQPDGRAVIDVWPRIGGQRELPADGEPLTLQDTVGLFRKTQPRGGWSEGGRVFFEDVELQLVEAI